MSPAERVEAACTHRPYDRVPTYYASFASRVASIILEREVYMGGAFSSGVRWSHSGVARMHMLNSLNAAYEML
ncbi:MAG: hypothetical protein ACUVRS_07425 [Armatimonadota bacterium]